MPKRTTKILTAGVLALVLLTAVAGCSGTGTTQAVQTTAPPTTAPPPTTVAPPAAAGAAAGGRL